MQQAILHLIAQPELNNPFVQLKFKIFATIYIGSYIPFKSIIQTLTYQTNFIIIQMESTRTILYP